MARIQTAVLLLILSTAAVYGVFSSTPAAKAAISFPAATGTTQEAVLTVQFPISSPSVLLSSSQPFLNSLAGQVSYYVNASYSRLKINYTVYGPYDLPQPESVYGQDSPNQIDVNKQQFLIDSLQAACSAGVNFANFQHITIVHAGSGQESSHNSNDIYSSWIGADSATSPFYNCNGIGVYRVIVLSEFSPTGTFAHEFGHDLGLPDLYDPNSGSTDDFVGPWSLMGSGNWLYTAGNPPGSSPSSLDSWSKSKLGWISPGNGIATITNATANVTIAPLELANQQVYAVKIPLSASSYYLMEVRRQIAVDVGLPNHGVLVLLVDESKVDSSGYYQAGVVLVQHQTVDLNAAPLQPGQSFADPAKRVFVKVLSQVGQGYRIQLTSHMLFITLQGPLQVVASQTASFVVHVTDENYTARSNIIVTASLDGRQLEQAVTNQFGNATFRITFNWTDIGLHTFLLQTQSMSDYIDGSQRLTLQVTLPPALWPVIAALIIVPIGLAVVWRRSRRIELPPPTQWSSASAYAGPTNYCSECGRAAIQGTSYCMYCGTRFR